MKKLLGIMVLGLLLSGNAYADEDMLLIQCQSDDPKHYMKFIQKLRKLEQGQLNTSLIILLKMEF